MILKAVIEVHQLLEACQVLLVSDEDLSQNKLQLSITHTSISLINDDNVSSLIAFNEIKVKPQTMSGLTIIEKSLFFRIQIESENNLQLKINHGIKYAPPFEKNKNFNLLCICCNNIICENVNFKRVLPLPSVDDWNCGDWFCHKHSNNDITKNDNKLKIVSKNDCLYDHYYFKINTDYIITKQFGVIHCDKCLSWIGVKSENYVKLWNSTVKLNYCIDDNTISPLSDFNNVILNKINNSISPVFKLIITCSVVDNSVHYLLLRIMDKNLTVLTNCNSSNDVITKLLEKKVVKVSYCYYNNKNEIVQDWFNDPLIEIVDVSKQMLFAGFESLIKSTKLIAKPYRTINSMQFGYLQLL